MHIFTRCPNGLGVVGGRHDTTVQGNFRKELIIAQKAEHPNFETEASLWCPVMKDWVYKDVMTAAHIFPWKQGQDTMTRIFGREAEHEMFSSHNGLLMSSHAEKRMDKGLFVIVPCANDETEADVKRWHLPSLSDTRYAFWKSVIEKCLNSFRSHIQKLVGQI